MIAPGYAATHKEHFSRRSGEVYDNNWLKIADGTPTSCYCAVGMISRTHRKSPRRGNIGYQFIDSTKLATLRLANRRGFGLRLLSHTLPRVLLPGTGLSGRSGGEKRHPR